MIIIQNQDIRRNGQTRYTIHINNEFIAEFWHTKKNGLGRCLLEASKAVEKDNEKDKWRTLVEDKRWVKSVQ